MVEELESLLFLFVFEPFPLEVLEQEWLGGDELDKLVVVDDMADTVDMRVLYTVGMLQGVDIDKAVGNILVVVRGGNCIVMVVDDDEPELVRLCKRAHGVLLDLDVDGKVRDIGEVVVDIEDD